MNKGVTIGMVAVLIIFSGVIFEVIKGGNSSLNLVNAVVKPLATTVDLPYTASMTGNPNVTVA